MKIAYLINAAKYLVAMLKIDGTTEKLMVTGER